MSGPTTISRVANENRYNFYHNIHKALRLGHCRLLAAIGSHDFTNADETAKLIADVRDFLVLAGSHLAGENREIHAALEARAPGASAHAAEDHEHHERSFVELEELLRAIETAPVSRREQAGHALYRRYALFAAADIVHMNEEETELLHALHNAFTDEELHAIEGRIVSAIPPAKMVAGLKLMMPAINQGERIGMLAKMRHVMPSQVFDAVIAQAVKPSLHPADWAAVATELDLHKAA
jgi:hypothetical protein